MLNKQAIFFTLNLLVLISSTQTIKTSDRIGGEFADRKQLQAFLQNEATKQQKAQEEFRRRAQLQQVVRAHRLDQYKDQDCCDMTVNECCVSAVTYCWPYIQTCSKPCLYECVKYAVKFHNWCGTCAMDEIKEKTRIQRMA